MRSPAADDSRPASSRLRRLADGEPPIPPCNVVLPVQSQRSRWLLLAGVGALAALAGFASGDGVVAIAVALGLYAAHQAWCARRLARMLRTRQRIEAPFASGLWNEMFVATQKLQRRNRARKRRVNRFLSRFQEAAAALPDAVLILGRDDRIEWRNPAAERLLGVAGNASGRTPVTALVRDPLFADYLARGDFARPLEMPAPRDRSVTLSLLVTPFGKRRQRVLIARDITRTFHLDQARKDFVANVSHELRTPLTVLSGNLEILAESGTGDEEAMESMRGNLERMGGLVDDLLVLSRLEMNAGGGGEEPIDVAALLSSIVAEARMLAADSHHTLHLRADPGLTVQGNVSQLRSAFSNLVHNAVRHTPARTRIDIRWYSDEKGAHLLVEDNGPGIPPRHLPRLTERFYRVDPSRSAHTGGTGLGLAIVKHALERHGATLSVSSREGQGTVFGCHFPVSCATEQSRDGTVTPASPRPAASAGQDAQPRPD